MAINQKLEWEKNGKSFNVQTNCVRLLEQCYKTEVTLISWNVFIDYKKQQERHNEFTPSKSQSGISYIFMSPSPPHFFFCQYFYKLKFNDW